MKFWIFVVVLMLLAVSVSAVQPTQNYLKLYMSPFYRATMSQNTNYTYQVNVTAPDGISKISSAIISLDAWISPTVTFSIWVNGQPCTTSNYSISTTYASAGRGVPMFDCANRIIDAGLYNVTIRPAGQNVGASTAWLDVTYLNNPQGSADVSGTEYVAGDPATIFVQLLDNNANPVENGNCYVDIYYPLSNGTHPYVVVDAPMVHAANGDDGLYYYDLTAPSQLGVYMVNARCAYNYDWKWIYSDSELIFSPIRSASVGTWSGGTLTLNSPYDSGYDQCQTVGSGTCTANYTFNISSYGTIQNITNINLYFLGEATRANTLTLSYWNGTAFVALSNTLIYVATGSTTAPSGVDQLLTNAVPLVANMNGTIKIQFSETSTGTHAAYNNWLSLAILSSYGSVIQSVKGNSEMHISGSSDTSDTRFYDVGTCNGYTDGRCGIFTNDAEFNLVEGEIEDFLNVTAKTTQNNVQVKYETPFTVDCTALYWVKRWNGTGWSLFTNYSVSSEPQNENCVLTLNQDMVGGQDYRYWVKMDNFMKWEVDWSKKMSDTMNMTIASICDSLNFTYVNPIINTTALSNNTMIGFCQQAKDDQYWINVYYADSQFVSKAGQYTSYVHELRFYRSSLQMRYEWLLHEGVVVPELRQINVTTMQINSTVNQTQSLVSQIWTWVQGLFNWSQQNQNQVVMKNVGG